MGARLAVSVIVRETEPLDKKHPELGLTVTREEFLVAGTEVPDWAKDLVPASACEGGSEGDPTDADGNGWDDSDPLKPAGNASLEAWSAYALSQGWESVEGKSRDEIRDQFNR